MKAGAGNKKALFKEKKKRQCSLANVRKDAEPFRKDWEGTMAIMMQSDSHHLRGVSLMVATFESAIERKIRGHEGEPERACCREYQPTAVKDSLY